MAESFDSLIRSDCPRLVSFGVCLTEIEIWRYVDAPRKVGGEELSIADFVKIFQLLVESMLKSYDMPCQASRQDDSRGRDDKVA